MFLSCNVWNDHGPFTWSIYPVCHIWDMKYQEDRVRWELSSSKSITWAFSFCFLLACITYFNLYCLVILSGRLYYILTKLSLQNGQMYGLR